MANALGLIGFALFVICVIGLAAGITWLVVRISPAPNSSKKKKQQQPPEPAESSG